MTDKKETKAEAPKDETIAGNQAGLVKTPTPALPGLGVTLSTNNKVALAVDAATDGESSNIVDKLNAAAVEEAAKTESAAEPEPEDANEGKVNYTCHPIRSFGVGPYQFENSVLSLDTKEAEKFDKLLESLPVSERIKIQKLDLKSAIALSYEHQQAKSTATQNYDSTTLLREAKTPKATTELSKDPTGGALKK